MASQTANTIVLKIVTRYRRFSRGEVNVRYGSLADISQRIRNVRFTSIADMLLLTINVR